MVDELWYTMKKGFSKYIFKRLELTLAFVKRVYLFNAYVLKALKTKEIVIVMKAKIAANNKNSLFVEKLKYLYVLFNISLVLINDGLAKTAKKGIIDEIPTISRMAIITDKKNKSNLFFFWIK